MPAEAPGIAFLHLNLLMAVDLEPELAHQHEGFLCGDDSGIGPAQQDLFERGAVVRLHVVDHEVVKRPSCKQVFEIFKQLAAGRPVHGVEKHRPLVEKQIGVVGDPAGNRVDILKKGQTVVVCTDPIEVFGYIADTIHCFSSSSVR